MVHFSNGKGNIKTARQGCKIDNQRLLKYKKEKGSRGKRSQKLPIHL